MCKHEAVRLAALSKSNGSNKLVHLRDVLGHGVVRAQALASVPCLPLGFAWKEIF